MRGLGSPDGCSTSGRCSAELPELELTLSQMRGKCALACRASGLPSDARGGKQVRPLALLLSAACFGPMSPLAHELAVVVELVHSATLLHDDVIDEGMERRGAPTARRLWGNGISVLSGDLLLVSALETTFAQAPELMPDLLSVLRRLVNGEIIQLRGRVELDPSPDTYERILRDKTASLFGWATRTGARIGGASHAEQQKMGTFGEELGFAFQLIDDMLDYCGEHTGKSLLADLAEGKLTLPLVLTVDERPELLALLRRIQAGDLEPLAAVGEAVASSGTLEVVRRRAQGHTERAIDALSAIVPSPPRLLLESVARELAARAT
jgi:octaprenyl-diphosphate synthase